jgi:O-antigen/teichoic acid export membrane protein
VDAKAGPLYAIWLRELQQGFYGPRVSKELTAALASLGGLPRMLSALENADPKWFGDDPKAGRDKLVRETFAKAVMLNTVVMVLVTVFLQWRPEVLIGFFTTEAEAQAVGATFLRIISWTFIAQGIVFTCSGVFQGLGNTIPAMLSSGIRIGVFVPLAVWLSAQPAFHLDQVWWMSVATVWMQAGVSYLLMRRELKRRLVDAPRPAAPAVAAAEG